MKVALSAVTGTRGGPRTYAVALLRALVALAAGDEFTLLSDEGDAAPDVEGIQRVRVPVPVRAARPFVEALAIPWALRRIDCDVFHATKQSLPAGVRAARVVTVHDLAPMILPETFPAGAGAWLRRSTAAAVRRAHRVIVPSETTARDVRERLGAAGEKVRVVAEGVDRRWFGPFDASRAAEARARLALPEEYVASIGTIQPRKNLDVVLDAMERLGDAAPPLVVAGRAGWMSAEVVRRAKASPRARWLGEVAEEDVPIVAAGASLFLSPSSYEGFGLAVAEAMAAGVAVIAGSGSASDEVVGDAGVLVPPRDADALADAVASLLADDARRSALAAAGRARVARFTWEEAARRTREVYAEAIEAAR